MRLSRALVDRVIAEGEHDDGPPPGLTATTPEDIAGYVATILGAEPDAPEIWIFAYGSLIWKPACNFVEIRTGVLNGWHRAFCLGWNTRFRGCVKNPGLMLALDRGGACNGVLYRLPPDAVDDNLTLLCQREMGHKPSSFPPRWVTVRSAQGPVRAVTFCVDRNGGRYVTGLDEAAVADVLAKAAGPRGSMAEYLYQTVRHLEDMGVHDSHLWRLQELVAERLEALTSA
jgi:cation transport protein ChaC